MLAATLDEVIVDVAAGPCSVKTSSSSVRTALTITSGPIGD